ncbi:MAG TPA: 3-dehydroquinate synthase, partial [Gemmatimonadaceae bacterium]|nr:3-dehydroquinate synthase [Gemmatimonadaceae bacterium]
MVTIESGLIHDLQARASRVAPAHRYAVISDTNVAPLYGEQVRASLPTSSALLTIPAGESQKTRESWARLTDEMLAQGFGRDSAIIAVGGGVVGDLAGFVAATYMRGIPFVQVPTTLVAMIDASIGGKTGVDTPAGKNLVGAFHQPAAVLIDPTVLGTLPERELRAGLAEAIKHGVIADAGYFDRTVDALPALLSPGGSTSAAMRSLIEGSVAIKSSVVARDEREHGLRKILNFGHTLGHAAEALSGYALLHGEAIAIGMAVESRLAERMGLAEAGTTEHIRMALSRAMLPSQLPSSLDPEQLVALTKTDKKARRGHVEYALPSAIGCMAGADSAYGIAVPDTEALAAARIMAVDP